jgi:predicted DNA-binding transcriptional regulator AlpA
MSQLACSEDTTISSCDHNGDRLLLTASEAAAVCSVSTRTWHAWDAAGRIPQPMRFGRLTRWRTDELRAWVIAGCPKRTDWQAAQR